MAACAYLVNRHPASVEVHANDDDNGIKIELIEECEYIENGGTGSA